MAKSTQAPAATPPEKTKPTESPDDWIAARAGVVGPQGERYAPGDVIPADEWNEQGRERLVRMEWIARRRDWKPPVMRNTVVPPPHLLAVPAGNQVPSMKLPKEPVFPHNADLGDGVECPDGNLTVDHKPMELEPGTEIDLADGTTYKVPFKDPELDEDGVPIPVNQTKKMDAEDGQGLTCNECHINFDGVASLKKHEAVAHKPSTF